MLKAVLFDLDGTLLDTLPDIQAIINQTLETFSYPVISTQQTREYIGEGAFRLVERSLPAEASNVQACFQCFSQIYAASKNEHTRLFDGAKELLSWLKAKGVKVGVVSNKPQDAVENCLAQFFPDFSFDFVGGDSGLFPCKPDPTLARYAALTMRVAPAECAFVGDGETDVRTAINANMFGVAVLWGYRDRSRLEKEGAKVFANDFNELKKILENY